MNLKIACPMCQHSLSIKDPKPGKYKPKCSGCGLPFALVIEEGDPPKVRTGKLPAPVDPDKTSLQPLSQPIANPSSDTSKNSQQEFASKPKRTLLGETYDSELNKPSAPSKQASGVEATLESAASPVAKAPLPTQGDFSVNEATRETPPNAGGSASAIANQVKPDYPSISKLGGYRIVKELGAGGMGSVYLARQLSLDRPCALKTIQAQWAQNPRVIARFIREAYAAAQLTHHNVVQIYDLGQDGGTNYFSMELVGGGSLDDLLKSKGRIQPRLAATLILQASRGLKFAHDHGMVHRDIKPANLMLTNDGLVKIADMGLVKTTSTNDSDPNPQNDDQAMMLASARSQVTLMGSSMGTPAYMSPEQSTDAASVDKRADIYSLGCTFYALLTGKPPFEGKTWMEVLSKHRFEKLVRPERVIDGLPTAIGDIIEKMTAKRPEDRYQDLDEVVHDIEVFLELRQDTSKARIIHSPRDRDDSEINDSSASSKPASVQSPVDGEVGGQLELASKRFQQSPLLLARRFAPIVWCGLCGLLLVLSLLFAATTLLSMIRFGAGGGVLASFAFHAKSIIGYALALVSAPFTVVLIGGLQGKSPLALRYRESLVAGGALQWIYWLFATLLGLLVIHMLGLWIPVLFAVLIGGAVGAGYFFGVEKPLAAQRQNGMEQAHWAVRQLRLRGMDEMQVRDAAMEHFGRDWEELFEQIFGYDNMRAMRSKLKRAKRPNLAVFRPIRDHLIDRWETRLADGRRAREEKMLAKAEKANLMASGVSESEARKKADALAASMVDAASETRQVMQDIALGKLTDVAALDKRQRIKQMMSDARAGKPSVSQRASRSFDRLLGNLLGSKFRFVCAALLLVATGLWVQSNQKPLETYWQHAKATVDTIKNTKLDGNLAAAKENLAKATSDATATITQVPKQSWNTTLGGLIHERNALFVGLAGLLMLWGTFWYGWKPSLLLVPLAAAAVFVPGIIF